MRKALVVALLVLPIAANAAVLLDNLKITDQQLYFTGNGNWIGGSGVFGNNNDLQLADDFKTDGTNTVLTSLTVDFLTFGVGPATQALVEVFPISGGAPQEVPLYTGTLNVSGANFNDTLFGLVGKRYTAALPNWALAANTSYYISMQPIGADWGYSPRGNIIFGGDSYLRDGGVDHGNGYAGGYGTNDFRSANAMGFGAGDVSMKVEAIPEPASMLLLGLAGLLIRRR